MINRMAAIMVCLVLVFSMVSCDDQGKAVGYGSLSVEISNGDGSKTIRPTDESLAFVSYRIEGRHRTIEGRTVDETFTDGNIEIDHLETGEWEFMVEGLNKDKVVLAKSDAHIMTIKTNGNAKETYTLDWIEGHGTLRLSVKVQTSRVSAIECKLYDEDGNDGTYVMTKDDSRLDDEGFLVFEHSFTNVPTGSYDATITMKDKDGGMIGRALHPSIHIHDSLVSSYGFSWENFRNLLPSVDVPKVTNIGEGETTVSCDSTILLGTEEDGTTIFYSLDGKTYSKYQEGAIDLSAMGNLNDSIAIWTYAEKANLNKSDVAEYELSIEHNSPDRANAVYMWNAVEGGYECTATSRCKYHKSVECETEKAVASYEILVDSTEHEEGRCRYAAVFEKKGYEKQVKDEVVPTKHELVHRTGKSPTCTEIGWNAYDTCIKCDYTTYQEIPAFGHDYVKTETKVPKCMDAGIYEYVCTICNHTEHEEIPSLGHNIVHHEAKVPTCTEIGWDAYDECTRGDHSTKVEKPALGHYYVKHEAKTVTCTEIGWDTYYTCVRCNYTTYKELSALGHNLKSLNRVDDELHEGVCSRCSKTIKGAHSFECYKCTKCGTWGRGPSGGYVFYDRGEYSKGEYSWRYLEAAPADLHLVNGIPTVDSTINGYSTGTDRFFFGYYRKSYDGSNLYVNGKNTKYGVYTPYEIGFGRHNTELLVSAMGSTAYLCESGTDTTSNYAARLCDVLEYEVRGKLFDDWFLPSGYELYTMYKNLQEKGLVSFADDSYWSSTETSADSAWKQSFSSGNRYDNSRYDDYRVRPVRAF